MSAPLFTKTKMKITEINVSRNRNQNKQTKMSQSKCQVAPEGIKYLLKETCVLSLALKLRCRLETYKALFNPCPVIMQRQISAAAGNRRRDGEADEVRVRRGRRASE